MAANLSKHTILWRLITTTPAFAPLLRQFDGARCYSMILHVFGILPMVPLEILPTVPLVAYGTIGKKRNLNLSRQPMVPGPMLPLVETLVPMVPLVVPMVPLVSSVVSTVI